MKLKLKRMTKTTRAYNIGVISASFTYCLLYIFYHTIFVPVSIIVGIFFLLVVLLRGDD